MAYLLTGLNVSEPPAQPHVHGGALGGAAAWGTQEAVGAPGSLVSRVALLPLYCSRWAAGGPQAVHCIAGG